MPCRSYCRSRVCVYSSNLATENTVSQSDSYFPTRSKRTNSPGTIRNPLCIIHVSQHSWWLSGIYFSIGPLLWHLQKKSAFPDGCYYYCYGSRNNFDTDWIRYYPPYVFCDCGNTYHRRQEKGFAESWTCRSNFSSCCYIDS